jgi:UDP-N-acetylmuramyl pentapeptide phosphotransferase/UDP-N-acetylglucosamine-1-phosphate transferase
MSEMFSIIQAFVIGGLLVYLSVPVVVKVSKVKKLFDFPDNRKVNSTVIPNLGGISLFFGISIASFLSLYDLSFPDLRYIMTGVTIMFFIGIKDDILTISPRKKFIAQLIAALLIIIPGDIRFSNLHGVFGLYEINYVVSILVSLLAFIAIINAVNLIDGIDGLASSVGIVFSIFFGFLFFQMEKIQYSIVCFATAGSLIVFFAYNVFGKKNKIFMGDTGSLILGVIVSVLVIKFNEFSLMRGSMQSNISPALSLAIISLPVFDMVRVFFVRLVRKKSPFVPDMNHIHHKLLFLGNTHLQSTLILISANLVFISLVYLMNDLNVNLQLFLLWLVVTLFSFIPNFFITYIRKREEMLHEEQSSLIMNTLKDFIMKSDYAVNELPPSNFNKNMKHISQKNNKKATSKVTF